MRNFVVMLASLAATLSILSLPFIALVSSVEPGEAAHERQLGKGLPLPEKPTHPRLDSQLNLMVERIGQMTPQAIADAPPLYQDASVAVTIRISANVPGVSEFLTLSGAKVANIGTDYIEAYVPVTFLARLAEQDDVLRVLTITPPHPHVTSQSASVHESPIWNTAGFTGNGVKVGIIDLGFIGYGGLMGTELPSTVVARCYISVVTFTSELADCETDSVYGTAVA